MKVNKVGNEKKKKQDQFFISFFNFLVLQKKLAEQSD